GAVLRLDLGRSLRLEGGAQRLALLVHVLLERLQASPHLTAQILPLRRDVRVHPRQAPRELAVLRTDEDLPHLLEAVRDGGLREARTALQLSPPARAHV